MMAQPLLLKVGGVLAFVDTWSESISNTWVVGVHKLVYKLGFLFLHPHCLMLSNLPMSPQQIADGNFAFADLLNQGVIVVVPLEGRFQKFYSILFTLPKPKRGIRPILDLKFISYVLNTPHLS